MSFLSSVKVPGAVTAIAPTSPTPKGNFLSSIKIAKSPQAITQNNDFEARAQVAKANSDYANSFTGLAVNTFKDIGSKISEQWNSGQEQIDQPFVAAQKAKATGVPLTQIQRLEGSLSAGSGVITKLSAPLAPVFNLLGLGVNKVGNRLEERIQQQHPEFEKWAASPQGETAIRILTDITNAANVAGAVVGGAEAAFRPKVKGGFLESVKTPEAPPTEPPPSGPVGLSKPLAQTHAEYSKSMGYEPYVPDKELPVIQMGEKTKGGLSTIQTEAPTARPVKGDVTFEPIKEQIPVTAPTSKPDVPFVPETPKMAPEGSTAPLKPVASLGEARTSTLASKVNAAAVGKKLSEGLGDLPEYNKVNMKEQAQFASDLVHNEPDKAMRIAMGQEPPPAHILPESVFTAVEDAATKAGDVETLRKLAVESNLSTQATAMGQRIRALAERDSDSAVAKIQEVKNTRATRATPKRVKTTVEEIKSAVKKSAPSKTDWNSFVESISCNY